MSSRTITKGEGRGILRAGGQRHQREGGDGNNEGNGAIGGRGVTFSNTVSTSTFVAARPRGDDKDDDQEYDSDDEDAVLASGDALMGSSSSRKRNRNVDDDDDDDDDVIKDAAVRSPSEVAEAKRKRGRVRRQEDKFDLDNEGDDDDMMRQRRYLDDGGPDDRDAPEYAGGNLSLITDRAANPDAYESNAYGNASCPVEPFNMDSERDGGLGYFDGDTYVFRRNRKPVDGEDDAWLDGASDDEDDNDEEEGSGQMALDSITSIRQNKSHVTSMEDKKKKSKYVSNEDRPEDLGRRLVGLLLGDEETVMMALARHGGSLRELRAREQKATKKVQLMKKRGKLIPSEEASDAATNDAVAAATKRQLKIEIESTRDVVEELTELADALLFGGETEAYELTRKDWNHRFKLDTTLGHLKRPLDDAGDDSDLQTAKKRSRGYFDNATDAEPEITEVLSQTEEVMWEYKGNEDGVIYGPYTSQQMMEWTSCGYFVGESSVDIRRVLPPPLGNNTAIIGGKKGEDVHADVDDLMADLLDDDDEDVETAKESAKNCVVATNAESSWLRSDRVDFNLYL